jgi:carboxypeptidase Taq
MTAYDQLLTELRSTALLESCSSVLGWDEQTYMPPGGAEHRANQLSLLAGMAHERATAPQLGELIAAAEANDRPDDPDSPPAVNLREARRHYDRSTKIPRRLVEELSRVCTLSQHAWVQARKDSQYADFLPWLEQVVALRREEAEVVGYGDGVPYDALLDEYEPGMTAAEVTTLFAGLRDELVPLIAEIVDCGRQPDISILERSYPVDRQREFSTAAAAAIGFDFHKGRLDEAAHPFCSGFGPGDTRLTTRYNEHHFPGAFFGTLHEAGHGIYDQGLHLAGHPRVAIEDVGEFRRPQPRVLETLLSRREANLFRGTGRCLRRNVSVVRE